MDSKKDIAADKLYFDGRGDVTSFVEKAELIAALKGHTDEKKAIFIASKLGSSAFDVYRRLSSDDKKNPEKIKEDLLKEFCREERNRDETLDALMSSVRSPTESPQRFAYKLLRLVGLAYSTLDDNTKKTIAKDYYVKGLSKELQVVLKSMPNFSTRNINELSDETTRLQIAGVKSETALKVANVELYDRDELIDKITKNVVEQLKCTPVKDDEAEINFNTNSRPSN